MGRKREGWWWWWWWVGGGGGMSVRPVAEHARFRAAFGCSAVLHVLFCDGGRLNAVPRPAISGPGNIRARDVPVRAELSDANRSVALRGNYCASSRGKLGTTRGAVRFVNGWQRREGSCIGRLVSVGTKTCWPLIQRF